MSYKPTIFTNISKPKTDPQEFIDHILEITRPWQEKFSIMANLSKVSENLKNDAVHNHNIMKTTQDKTETVANQYRANLMTKKLK